MKMRRLFAGLSSFAILLSISLTSFTNILKIDADASVLDIEQTISSGKWKTTGDGAITVTNKELIAGSGNFYLDEDITAGTVPGANDNTANFKSENMDGGLIEFEIKLDLKDGATLEDSDWQIIFGLQDKTPKLPHYDDDAIKIQFEYISKANNINSGAKNDATYINGVTANNVPDITDGEYHKVGFQAATDGWGNENKAFYAMYIDDVCVIENATYRENDLNFITNYKTGKFSIYNRGNFDVTVRAVQKPIVEEPTVTYDFRSAMNGGLIKSGDGSAITAVDNVIDYRDGSYMYIDQNVAGGSEVAFKMKANKIKDGGNWQLALGIVDQAIGKYFWDNGAKNVTIQFIPTDNGTKIENAVNDKTGDPTKTVIGVKDTDVKIFDGEWHKIIATYDKGIITLNVDGAVIMSMDLANDEGIVGQGDIDLATTFKAGRISFYSAGNYNVSYAPIDEPDPVKPPTGPTGTFDFKNAITNSLFKNPSNEALTIVDGVVDYRNNQYMYIDKQINNGEEISFKMKSEKLSDENAGGWQLALGVIDQNIEAKFWEGTAKSAGVQFSPVADGTEVLFCLTDNVGGVVILGDDTPGSRLKTDKKLFDGEWHSVSVSFTQGLFVLKVDGEEVVRQDMATDPSVQKLGAGAMNVATAFVNGKVTFYNRGNYNMMYTAIDREEPAPPPAYDSQTVDMKKLIEEGKFQYNDGVKVEVDKGVVKALDSEFFQVNHNFVMGDTVKLKIKADAIKDAPAAGWDLTIGLLNQSVEDLFWKDNAKSINLQLMGYEDGEIGASVFASYKDGSVDKFAGTSAYYGFESSKALFDGEWHDLAISLVERNGNAVIYVTIDGEKFIEQVFGDTEILNAFKSGKLTFYSSHRYNFQYTDIAHTSGGGTVPPTGQKSLLVVGIVAMVSGAVIGLGIKDKRKKLNLDSDF